MNLTINAEAEATEVVLAGRFDAFEVERFNESVDPLVDQEAHDLRVRLADVEFIDSSGLAALIRAMKHRREVGGDLTLVAPSDPVRVILELTRLDIAFDIVD